MTQCAHGHMTRQVGCVSCVMVFDELTEHGYQHQVASAPQTGSMEALQQLQVEFEKRRPKFMTDLSSVPIDRLSDAALAVRFVDALIAEIEQLATLSTASAPPRGWQPLREAAERLVHRLYGFNEKTQTIWCSVCRYRDPLVDGTKLHADDCPLFAFHAALDALLAPPASPSEECES